MWQGKLTAAGAEPKAQRQVGKTACNGNCSVLAYPEPRRCRRRQCTAGGGNINGEPNAQGDRRRQRWEGNRRNNQPSGEWRREPERQAMAAPKPYQRINLLTPGRIMAPKAGMQIRYIPAAIKRGLQARQWQQQKSTLGRCIVITSVNVSVW